MSWRLVASTSTGWKKYETNNGNFRYKRPNGKFANENQYNGSLSKGEEKDETEKIRITPPPREPEYTTKDQDFKTYEVSNDHIIRVNKGLCDPDDFIPWDSLWDDMMKIARKYDSKETEFSFGITYQIITEDEVMDRTERHTHLRDSSEFYLSNSEFYNIVNDLQKLCDTYKEVLINDVRVKERIQNDDF